jgi:hypothetical protein
VRHGAARHLGALLTAAVLTGPPARAEDERSRRSVTSRDLDPRHVVHETGDLRIALGALVQVNATVLGGSDLFQEGDGTGEEPGLWLRRARFGTSATLLPRLELLLTVNLVETDFDVDGIIADAQVAYEVTPALGFTVGTMRPPFSRSALDPAGQLSMVERPFVVTELRPTRRLGLMVDGRPLDGRFTYMVGLMNATEGFLAGNEDGGWLGGARLEAAPFGTPDPEERDAGLSIAANAYATRGADERRTGVSADALFVVGGVSLLGEALWDRREDDTSTQRLGAYAELGYAFPVGEWRAQVIARGEVFDADRGVRDEDDVYLAAAGLNVEWPGERLRLQLQHVTRVQRHGARQARQGLALSLRAEY